MFNKKFMEELFKPQELYSKKALRTVYDRLAHASIMRLNQASMDKVKKTTCPVLTKLYFHATVHKFLTAIISTWLYVTVILKHFVTAVFVKMVLSQGSFGEIHGSIRYFRTKYFCFNMYMFDFKRFSKHSLSDLFIYIKNI